MMSVTVPKHVHQRTGEQEQIGQSEDEMAGVIPDEVRTECGQRERDNQTRLGTYEASELFEHGEVSSPVANNY
jgi:hypothetical protein